jgi:hypothetical protein
MMELLRSIVKPVIGYAILAALLFILWRAARFYVEVIEPYRKRTGYLVRYFGGREPGDGISVSYYERDKELHFFSDRDERIFYVPDEKLWDQTMPDFFKGKQPSIVQRLKRRIPKRVSLRLVDTYPADRSIHYVDQSKPRLEKVRRIGNPTQ